MKTLLRAAALATLIAACGLSAHAQTASPATSEAMFNVTTLSLSAYGEVRVAPDMATINLGVTTNAATAAEAMRQNAAQMTQVMGALTRQGIAQKDIQTSGLNLSPQYDYRDNQPPVLRGYQAQNEVVIRVLDLSKLGPSLDAVVAAGSNQISGISFGLVDPKAAEDSARRQAVEALKAKADLYAQATGSRVVRLVNLSEGGSEPPEGPRPMMAVAAMARAGPTPISSGDLTVRIDVTGLYQITPAR